ncbi:hypothetical protein, partial [Fournierella sp.]|uniref:hypothetical protein n=1 Tax=Allofournierella sp. TaxID=1940256 RepID=UPI00307A816B
MELWANTWAVPHKQFSLELCGIALGYHTIFYRALQREYAVSRQSSKKNLQRKTPDLAGVTACRKTCFGNQARAGFLF